MKNYQPWEQVAIGTNSNFTSNALGEMPTAFQATSKWLTKWTAAPPVVTWSIFSHAYCNGTAWPLACSHQLQPADTSVEKIWYAKKLYESAYHPDTGDMMNVIGRMSFQVPGGMVITGFMLQFYRTTPQVFFWQWVNQSFNALVNYTNRNAKSSISTTKLGVAYVSATTSALVTALGLKSYLEKRAPPFLQRFVPFAAVAAANCINIPLMRQSELSEGIPVFDDRGNQVTESKLAAAKGITQVVVSRIAMAAPGMIILPFIMEYLEKFKWMQGVKVLHAPIQTVLVGGILLIMTPTACALFPQRCSLTVKTLERWEPESYKKLQVTCANQDLPSKVYFNKGL